MFYCIACLVLQQVAEIILVYLIRFTDDSYEYINALGLINLPHRRSKMFLSDACSVSMSSQRIQLNGNNRSLLRNKNKFILFISIFLYTIFYLLY